MKKYDIFLSYRHKGGWETAKHIYDLLTRDGYSVSFDIDTFREGFFDVELFRRIDECTDFVVILDEHVFDRSIDPNFDRQKDWLRIELAYALKQNKNIIPIRLVGFKGFPDNLPEDISRVAYANAPKYDIEFFNASYNRLKHFMKSSPHYFLSFINDSLTSIMHNKKIFGVSLIIIFLCLLLNTVSRSGNKGLEKVMTAEDMYNEGKKYYYGNGVTQDYKQAVSWYQKAAENGNVSAMINLGYCYKKGKGVFQDYEHAVSWYRKAAENGNADAMYNLGECYYYGYGVTLDYEHAVSWYRKAAENGNADAMYSLGYCYKNGEGLSQDYEHAVSWYEKSAKKGNADAMNNLGCCYHKGIGVVENRNEALRWFQKAANKGNAIAIKNLRICHEKYLVIGDSRAFADELNRASKVGNVRYKAHAFKMVKEALK